jgi:hypothetical protein
MIVPSLQKKFHSIEKKNTSYTTLTDISDLVLKMGAAAAR